MAPKLTITAFSTALFSTWVFIEEFGLVFDAGDGLAAGLLQKSRKVRRVFVTHADRDHVTGLLQLNQLNDQPGHLAIHYPADCGSFPALRDFAARFDPQSSAADWNAVQPGDIISIGKDHSVFAMSSDHITAPNLPAKALRYVLQHRRRVLRSEFSDLPGSEIARLRQEQGADAVTEERVNAVLGYSGDVSGLEPANWTGVKILLHECTFLAPDTARRPHSNLKQVISAAAEMPLEALVLMHFSSRYTRAEIEDSIRREASLRKLNFPVFAIFPGVVAANLLGSAPVYG